jgi:hypothetical protein
MFIDMMGQLVDFNSNVSGEWMFQALTIGQRGIF